MSYDRHIDPISGGAISIDVIHERVHVGKLFTYSDIFTMTAGQVVKMIVRVPEACYPHIVGLVLSGTTAPLVSRCYENPTITSLGSAIPVTNNNRNYNNGAELEMYAGSTTTVNGTQISTHLVPGEKQSGGLGSHFFNEYILKPNTDYLFTLENQSTQSGLTQIFFQWYE